MDTSTLGALLKDVIEQYEAKVSLANGARHTFQERMKVARQSLESNKDHVAKANELVDLFLSTCREAFDETPGIQAALFKAITSKLSTAVKEERDLFINGFDGKDLARASGSEVKIDPVELKNLQVQIHGLFAVLKSMGTVPDGLKLKTTKDGGQVIDIPRLPRSTASNPVARVSAIKKMIWTVDGVEYPGYSIAMMRKILGADTVQEIRDAIGIDGNWPDSFSFKFKAKNVDYRIAGALTEDEASAIDADDDDDNGDDD